MKIKNILKWIFNSYIWLGVTLLVIDIITKNIVVQNQSAIMNGGGQNGGVDLIPGFLGINYVINNKIVFGLDIFKNDVATRIVFVVVALGISAGLIVFLVKKWDKLNRFYKACIMMILSGAIGNCIDRIFFSSEYLHSSVTGVVDWIDFYGIWGFNFNIADSAVVVAAFMLVIYMIVIEILDYAKKKKLEPKKEKDNTKVISKTEQEKNKYLDKKDTPDA